MNAPKQIARSQVLQLPLAHVIPDPNNPRKEFDEDALQDLADDIAQRGVEQPITVYPIAGGFYRIKLGERRYRASKLAGMETIPALVAADDPDDTPELDRLLDQVKENCLRKDLTPIEWGHFFKRLREDFNLQVKDIPEMLEQRGMKRISRSYISNFMRLTELPEWASAMIASGKIPASWGKHLLVACESPKVEQLIREALQERAADNYNEWDAIHTESDLQEAVIEVFVDAHPRLDRRCTTWDERQPLYRAADLTDDDKAALQVRTIGGIEFVLDLDEHERRQQAARDADVKPARSSYVPGDDEDSEQDEDIDDEIDRDLDDASPRPTREPAKKEALPSQDKVSEYLTAWLRRHIVETVFDQECGGKSAAQDLARRLMAWSAFGSPDKSDHGDYVTGDTAAMSLLRGTAQELGLPTLGHFLTDSVDPSHQHEQVARALLARMGVDNLMLVAVWLGIDLEAAYKLDADYLELHTRAGLEKLAKDCKVKLSSTLPAKVGEIRDAYLEIPTEFGTPPQLIKLWRQRLAARQTAKFAASLKSAKDTPEASAEKKPKSKRKAKKQVEASADAAE